MLILAFVFAAAASILALLAFGAAGAAMSKAGQLEKDLDEIRRKVAPPP